MTAGQVTMEITVFDPSIKIYQNYIYLDNHTQQTNKYNMALLL